MDQALVSAFAPLLRDLRATGAPQPVVEDGAVEMPGHVAAMMWDADGTGRGVSVQADLAEPERVAELADQLQEWAVEALWSRGQGATWPQCPVHPDSHPLRPGIAAGRAVWTCPVRHQVIAEVGAL